MMDEDELELISKKPVMPSKDETMKALSEAVLELEKRLEALENYVDVHVHAPDGSVAVPKRFIK